MVDGESPDFAARQGRTLGVESDTASIGIITDVGFTSTLIVLRQMRRIFVECGGIAIDGDGANFAPSQGRAWRMPGGGTYRGSEWHREGTSHTRLDLLGVFVGTLGLLHLDSWSHFFVLIWKQF